MSITINYRRIQDSEKHLYNGTSAEWNVLKKHFGTDVLNTGDVDKLRAMHAATGRDKSIWQELADILDVEPAIAIKLWDSY